MWQNNNFINNLNLLILNVGFAKRNANWNWENIYSPFVRIYLVSEGNAQIIMNDRTINLKPNYLYLIPSFTLHSCKCDGVFKHYYLHIYEDVTNKISVLEDLISPFEIPADEMDFVLFKSLCKINPSLQLSQYNPQAYDNNSTLIENIVKNNQRQMCDKVASRGIVYILFSHFLKYSTSILNAKDYRIKNSIIYIRKHISQNINLEALSNDCCLSKDHFIRLFKDEMGTTPTQYINEKKIEKAQLLLVTEDVPIKEIAFKLSFNDVSYFNRMFKKSVGITPVEYKKKYS